ncbi:cytochrome o ubiquinol oxidase subunit IV [Photorhabdus temperata]|uniref:Cytochrome bo(3) ubiquinol oxidase subunit 4 n=2 Tax=Photorhabdus temperata TaxID=574560 RepID=A0A081S241_PHOTE|nr:cytochrome o ubiquinol oxidase subunit IV [Photorhabdus temperata]EQC01382.1 cytochrome o ubiquinol oxidase subunit IV [Photorhabdus temperata subsp. temperata M1021]ERT14420.1 cytochrome O ubiquinol oxidase [Photorhabdus temperata J3]KER04994.1 cytochrome bo3 quinol oxidase subunit 4 [Photorhabdus temperata subsp. temperata Meg1]MCT8346064.1 cytochrome o ubiquinol oxidase subunit IV [Photorhabdus temperata]
MSHSNTAHTGASHGSLKSYIIGFVLSVILTVIPFWMVMDGSASHTTILTTVVALAVVQILVHFIYFLHMNTSSEERWNLVALLFTILIIGIVVVGSLWIMYNLNINMMVD